MGNLAPEVGLSLAQDPARRTHRYRGLADGVRIGGDRMGTVGKDFEWKQPTTEEAWAVYEEKWQAAVVEERERRKTKKNERPRPRPKAQPRASGPRLKRAPIPKTTARAEPQMKAATTSKYFQLPAQDAPPIIPTNALTPEPVPGPEPEPDIHIDPEPLVADVPVVPASRATIFREKVERWQATVVTVPEVENTPNTQPMLDPSQSPKVDKGKTRMAPSLPEKAEKVQTSLGFRVVKRSSIQSAKGDSGSLGAPRLKSTLPARDPTPVIEEDSPRFGQKEVLQPQPSPVEPAQTIHPDGGPKDSRRIADVTDLTEPSKRSPARAIQPGRPVAYTQTRQAGSHDRPNLRRRAHGRRPLGLPPPTARSRGEEGPDAFTGVHPSAQAEPAETSVDAPVPPSTPPRTSSSPAALVTPVSKGKVRMHTKGLGNARGLLVPTTPSAQSPVPTLSELLASSRRSRARPRPPSRRDSQHEGVPLDADADMDGAASSRPSTPDHASQKTYFSSPASGSSNSGASPLAARGRRVAAGRGRDISLDADAHPFSQDPRAFAPPFTSTQEDDPFAMPPAPPGRDNTLMRGSSGFLGGGPYCSQFDLEAHIEQVSELLDRDVDFNGWLRDLGSESGDLDGEEVDFERPTARATTVGHRRDVILWPRLRL
ncbi:uncharacterized protein BXZ73DRAFT_107561 [Epithele typhae]|uniref:uncharacterized protein n=1 Tax=Epithele typhae TaxID=378194 RepID=UPI002008AC3C|nr:uncharacterized protein BXZ73DRAFT_107561 [Epithele typhae]KAH9912192.1 hypothetical protein BXZ73DRAFT_107561 [Epithele typhae]